jgi:hypothetical protein
MFKPLYKFDASDLSAWRRRNLWDRLYDSQETLFNWLRIGFAYSVRTSLMLGVIWLAGSRAHRISSIPLTQLTLGMIAEILFCIAAVFIAAIWLFRRMSSHRIWIWTGLAGLAGVGVFFSDR